MIVPANSWIEALPKFGLYPVSVAFLLDTQKIRLSSKSLILKFTVRFTSVCTAFLMWVPYFVAYKLDVVVVNKLCAYIYGVLFSMDAYRHNRKGIGNFH